MKHIIPPVLMFFLVFFAMGSAFAEISVELQPKTNLNVGDTVTITVTACNDMIIDWYPVSVYAPLPDGLQYISHVVPDKVQQNYDPSTGIWDINRMRHDERGKLKYLIITCKVLPSAAGKRITATARFQKVAIELNGRDITADQAPARSESSDPVNIIAPVARFMASPLTGTAPLTVYFTDTSSNSPTSWAWDFNGDGIIDNKEQNPDYTYNKSGTYMVTLTASNSAGQSTKTIFITVNEGTGGTGGGFGGGNGNGNGAGNGSNSGLGSAAGLLNQQSGGGGGNGKAYEVFQDTPKSEIYYGLAIILIVAMILMGYLYENKRKQ